MFGALIASERAIIINAKNFFQEKIKMHIPAQLQGFFFIGHGMIYVTISSIEMILILNSTYTYKTSKSTFQSRDAGPRRKRFCQVDSKT